MATKKEPIKEKIIIAMPCTDIVRARTAHAIGCAVIGAKGVEVIDFLLRQSCDIVSSRTWLVNEAIAKGATHILFVDADMCFPEDVIPRMLAHKKEIVGVEYNKRKFPVEGTYTPMKERADTLYEARYAGTGLMLIDLSIFKTMKGPWFNFGRDSQGALVLGEDVWFCNSARDSGFKTWIDPTIKVAHVGEYLY